MHGFVGRHASREPGIARTALDTEAARERERFEQRRLAAPVLADEKQDALPDVEAIERGDRRNGERVLVPVRDPLAHECDPRERRRLSAVHAFMTGPFATARGGCRIVKRKRALDVDHRTAPWIN